MEPPRWINLNVSIDFGRLDIRHFYQISCCMRSPEKVLWRRNFFKNHCYRLHTRSHYVSPDTRRSRNKDFFQILALSTGWRGGDEHRKRRSRRKTVGGGSSIIIPIVLLNFIHKQEETEGRGTGREKMLHPVRGKTREHQRVQLSNSPETTSPSWWIRG